MENIAQWRKAGKIASEALEYGLSLIKKDALLVDICDKVDAKIISLGGKPAFPSQVALNDVAAHFCPNHDDKSVFGESLVKLDVGAHVDGCIGDTAGSKDLSGKYSDLIKAARDARDAAVKIVQLGVPISLIGKTIQETIQSYGFSPVKNLSGHGIKVGEIHTKPTIPNVKTAGDLVLKEGIIAIEPFASTGAGIVYEGSPNTLYALHQPKPVRSPSARQLLNFIAKEYGQFPFTTRWLVKEFGAGKTAIGLRELQMAGCLETHPPLLDQHHGMVSQSEHTIYVSDKVEVLTR